VPYITSYNNWVCFSNLLVNPLHLCLSFTLPNAVQNHATHTKTLYALCELICNALRLTLHTHTPLEQSIFLFFFLISESTSLIRNVQIATNSRESCPSCEVSIFSVIKIVFCIIQNLQVHYRVYKTHNTSLL
jgi:hypothetical protein